MTVLWLCLGEALAECQWDLQQQGEKSKGKTVHSTCGQFGWGLWRTQWRLVWILPVKSCQRSLLFRAWHMMSAGPTSSWQGRCNEVGEKTNRIHLFWGKGDLICKRVTLILRKLFQICEIQVGKAMLDFHTMVKDWGLLMLYICLHFFFWLLPQLQLALQTAADIVLLVLTVYTDGTFWYRYSVLIWCIHTSGHEIIGGQCMVVYGPPLSPNV